MKTKFKTQIIVMLLISFVTLNVDYSRLSENDEETKVLVTYASKFQKANVEEYTVSVANDIKTGQVAKVEQEEAEKKAAEEAKQKAIEEAKKNNVTYYAEDSVGTNTNLELATQIVDYALQFVGNHYVYGGNSLTNGTDCSGFTSLVFANFGISLPRTSYSQGYVGVYVNPNNRQIGDLILYGYDGQISHAALYIGNNQVVHALNSNTGIVVTDYSIMPVITVRRVL